MHEKTTNGKIRYILKYIPHISMISAPCDDKTISNMFYPTIHLPMLGFKGWFENIIVHVSLLTFCGQHIWHMLELNISHSC
jgi:hypothetical protein